MGPPAKSLIDLHEPKTESQTHIRTVRMTCTCAGGIDGHEAWRGVA